MLVTQFNQVAHNLFFVWLLSDFLEMIGFTDAFTLERVVKSLSIIKVVTGILSSLFQVFEVLKDESILTQVKVMIVLF